MSEWKTYKLGDFTEINPRISLKQGNEYSFVEMKDLDATFKYVSPSTKKELKGGAKFQNGDTLFARITPCLENGKICQVKNLDNNVGFGSTEFLVFRGKENISNSDFVYYLSRSEFVKNNAIQMMTGTSGRQRVEKLALQELEITVPNLATQTQIAKILTSLDDKIELNLQMNQTLEAMAQALFKEWFVNFNFPNFDGVLENGLPKGWRKLNLSDLVETVSKTFKFPNGNAIFLNTSDISEGKFLHSAYSNKGDLPGQAKKSIQKGDILFSEIRPANKRYAYVDFDANDYVVSTKLMVLRSKGLVDNLLVYFFMKSEEVLNQLQMLAETRSGTFPQITYFELSKIEINVPSNDVLQEFTEFLKSSFIKIRENQNQIQSLTQTRDTLLPKLMSGKIAVQQ